MQRLRPPKWLWAAAGCLLIALGIHAPRTALADSGPPPLPTDTSTADHSQFPSLQGPFENAMQVTQACLECHNEAADQVMHTIHWTWEYQDPVSGKTLGKKHDINNFCVSITSNWARCTSCHAGYGWKDNNFDFTDPARVDCLICHDTTGTYKKFPAGAGFPVSEPKEFPPGSGKIWEPPDLAYVAQHVGQSSRTNCGACHFYGGGGDGVKHGDMDSSLAAPPREVDVHMSPDGANLTCADCHAAPGHQIMGSRYNAHPADPHGKDLPVSDGNPATCQSCHGNAPMKDPKLNEHVAKVACQTCHIPAFARGGVPTKMWWDWSKAGDKARGVETDEHGWEVYNYLKGEFVDEVNVIPTYAWFNGHLGFTVEGEKVVPEDGIIYINKPHGSPNEADARIYPFKAFRGIQAYDPVNQLLIVPHLFPFNADDTSAYWKGFNWETAFEVGMKTAGLPYSGQYEWAETEMYWPITHMVAPAEQALNCSECHSQQSRLAGITGVYIPGRDRNQALDAVGWGLAILALLGVLIHGGLRFAAARKS
ncbi:MAG: tetrathionate reductase family octaheme c-type cytochrome [Chloroflexi bacterium]|nr:tetrathionate reductase family octaheme c-type cytochrome [Chloroflexota bacterium]